MEELDIPIDTPTPIKQIQLSFAQQSTYQVKEDGHIQKNTQKKRITVEQWSFAFDPIQHSSEKQLELLTQISTMPPPSLQKIHRKMIQEIKNKIHNYKQQDVHKKIWNEAEFITFPILLERLIQCQLKCYYCTKEMHVLYDMQRQSSQWSVDRIDNTLGHNIHNFYLSCLECNLKRRRRSDSKFLMAKQMTIVKH